MACVWRCRYNMQGMAGVDMVPCPRNWRPYKGTNSVNQRWEPADALICSLHLKLYGTYPTGHISVKHKFMSVSANVSVSPASWQYRSEEDTPVWSS